MKANLLIAGIYLTLTLMGCSNTQPKIADLDAAQIETNSNTAPATANKLTSTAITPGIYIWGHEVSSFQPCDSQLVYWVRATPATKELKQLSLTLSELRAQAYPPIYIEAELIPIARDSNPAFADGFAADYDGIIEIITVVRQTDKIPEGCIN